MLCYRARKMISLEIDGLLPAENTSSLDSHLQKCTSCLDYREDLRMGSRMLDATTPSLPDNFNWKLQLRLGRALQEAAAEKQDLLDQSGNGVLVWVRSFALSSLAGAAVMAVLMIWVLPGGVDLRSGPNLPGQSVIAEGLDDATTGRLNSAIGNDRLPLGSPQNLRMRNQPTTGLLTSQRSNPFATGQMSAQSPFLFNRTSMSEQDVLGRLRLENTYLKKRLDDEAAENMRLKALLAGDNIDLLNNGSTSQE